MSRPRPFMSPGAAPVQAVVERVGNLWEALRGKRIFMTGGTGFVGAWLAASFAGANDRYRLRARMTLLTRRPDAARTRLREVLASRAVDLLEGDVRSFEWPAAGFDYIVHGAADVSPSPTGGAFEQVQALAGGTQHVLEMARRDAGARVLLVSSGAVYGTPAPGVDTIAEHDYGALDPLDAKNAYAEGKRLAEWLAVRYAEAHGLRVSIARCFAMLGPGMDLDAHFAAAQFLKAAISGAPVVVRGGRALRSYLYAGDVAGWLWRMALSPSGIGIFNVGSEHALSTLDLARAIARHAGVPLKVTEEGAASLAGARFVPDTGKARAALGVREWVSLDDALADTLSWYGASSPS